ncbi:PREDICTED: uncharacterized protein LOC106815950, partial [Priapulus caudatus]|uniref:Uncharacterized protein LOC106815950 n=1 Tax=Priapulus caudatus TaxID=37621 RepID=A0ABM1EUV1_PRICU
FQHFSKSEDAAPPRAAARDPRSPLVTQIRALAAAERAPAPPGVDYDALVAAIRRHVLVSRRRVCEYFQDFDPLRSASISTNHFRRGLSALGLSALGKLNMNDAEFECLARHYRDPRRPSNVLWTNFVSDIECVFTEQQQEKTPSLRAPRQEVHQTPAAAGKETEAAAGEKVEKEAMEEEDWCGGDAGTRACYDAAMRHMREKSQQRRILTKPCFQDFDRHNNGHVTRAQFQQCMTYLMLAAGETEMAAIEAKFSDDVGFNYVAFLKVRECALDLDLCEGQGKHRCSYLYLLLRRYESANPDYVDYLRYHAQVNTGVLTCTFHRAGKHRCSYLYLLPCRYESANPDYVDYLRFSDDVESIFVTKGLEKNPQLKPQRFRPPVAADGNKLSGDKEALLTMCMKRLAEKVRKRRMQLFPLFEDYDCVHNGTVSRSQFRRVLSELDLGALVSEREFLLIFEKFEVKVGGKVDSNYIAFCDMIYELAQFERWRP